MRTSSLFEPLERRQHLTAAAVSTAAADLASLAAGAPIAVPFARAQRGIVDLSSDLYGLVRDHGVPAAAAGVMQDGALVAIGANGRRVAGKKDKVTTNDAFHLGSSGKAMTSTMVARLIEEKKLDWNSTIAGIFPELKGKITKGFEGVTVWQLMTNRSGVSDTRVQNAKTLIQLGTLRGSRQQQRAAMVPIVLKTTPNGTPGANFEYSNFGYAILGAMAERVTKTSFETLMYNYVFKPLGMATANFGAQGKDSKVYQPRGHDASGRARTSSNDDLLPYLAPAGTMSMSVVDWGKFLKAHMGLKVGKTTLLKSATLERLHTPYNGAGTSYAAGWVVTKVLGVTVLSHDGTNGNWYSTVQLIPSLKYAAYDVVNAGGPSGMAAAYAIKSKLMERYPFFG